MTAIFPRVIPCLLLKGQGLYKTVRFKDPKYVGDPINAVKIFNEKEVDELVFLDIGASREGRGPNFAKIEEIAGECFMPLSYGGGISSLDQIRTLFTLGVEKVVINSHGIDNPALIRDAAERYGSQSVVASIDVKKSLFGRYQVVTHAGSRNTGKDPAQVAAGLAQAGAGEIFLNSVDRDGTMQGFDLPLLQGVTRKVGVPVIACGGAGSLEHLEEAVRLGGASAVAAGSMFVFQGRHRAVLISYPGYHKIKTTFRREPLAK